MTVAEVEEYLVPWMVRLVQHEFSERDSYFELTLESMRRSRAVSDPEAAAGLAYWYYICSQFFDRLLIATDANSALRQGSELVDLSGLRQFLDAPRPTIFCSFHQSRYLMFGAAMYQFPMTVIGLKARPDIIERFGQFQEAQSQIVYTVDRSTPIHMLRALNRKESVAMMIDHVHPQGEVHTIEFLGQPINVNLGAAWVAHNSDCPIVPLGLHFENKRYVVTPYAPVLPRGSIYDTIQDVYTALEPAVRREPHSWTRWFTAFADDREVQIRPRLRAANGSIWEAVTRDMGLQAREAGQ
jgi:lauroyl/myristoyl acyltransferase